MPEDNPEQSGFKVVDRRPFAPDGSRREVSREGDLKAEAPPGPTAPRPAKSNAPLGASSFDSESRPKGQRTFEPDSEYEPGGSDSGFNTLVSYLYTTSMFQMGLMQGPGGERIPADLPNARRTVDMLEVLQEKTRGNLTPGESKLLEDVLYDLRLIFVDVQEQAASKKR